MKTAVLFVALSVLHGLAACTEAAEAGKGQGEEGQVSHAEKLEVAPPAEGAIFKQPEVEVMESMPVQFAIRLTKQIPMPGVTVKVESVGAPDPKGVIEAKLHEVVPDAPGLTVIDHVPVRLAIGSLAKGPYELVLLVRHGDAKSYERAQALRLTAR